jgi:hypothetical protein
MTQYMLRQIATLEVSSEVSCVCEKKDDSIRQRKADEQTPVDIFSLFAAIFGLTKNMHAQSMKAPNHINIELRSRCS